MMIKSHGYEEYRKLFAEHTTFGEGFSIFFMQHCVTI